MDDFDAMIGEDRQDIDSDQQDDEMEGEAGLYEMGGDDAEADYDEDDYV